MDPAQALIGVNSAAAPVAVVVSRARRLVCAGAGVAVAVSGALLVWAGERAVALPAATAMRSVRPEGIVLLIYGA